jgi:Zn-dependent protease with chaperone function
MAEAVIEQMACPACRADVPLNKGYVYWCAACDWGVDPAPPPKLNWRDRYFANASARASRKLYDRIVAKGINGPPPRSQLINLIAVVVHLLTAITFVGGVLILSGVLGLPLAVRLFFGLLLLSTAFVVQPFWHRNRRKRAKPATREQLPELYSLVDEIAKELGCRGLDGIRFDIAYNASIGHTRSQGWVMTLGLPLWSTLSPQQRVALIGHELGHQLNRDQRNGMLVHGAAISMRQWSYLLTPSTVLRQRGGGTMGTAAAAAGELVANLLLLPLAAAAAGLSRLLTIFAGRQGLSAEYYADALSARVAGSDAAASSLENHLLAPICVRQLQHIAKFDKEADPWTAISAFADTIPAHEIERQRRLGRLHLPAINSTHPPTQLRADLVRALPHETGTVILDAGRAAAIERELEGPRAGATKLLRSYYPR